MKYMAVLCYNYLHDFSRGITYMDHSIDSRLEKRYARHRQLQRMLKENAADILESPKFNSTRNYIQHGTISVRRHSIDVAKQSILFSRALRLKVNERELIRGALLHDFFLYDWHDKNRENYSRWHGFSHAGIALKNAMQEYELSDREKNIIQRHMWPLNITPPNCKEAWIVSAADKFCSALETLRFRKGAAGSIRKGVRGK